MQTDIFEKIRRSTGGPIGQYRDKADGYFAFPKLEGELGPHMRFAGKEVLCWSLNNYLGLANHPEIRKVDGEAAARWGMAYPMGSRMMTGQTALHEKFERMLADFEKKEAAFLFMTGALGILDEIVALKKKYSFRFMIDDAHGFGVMGPHGRGTSEHFGVMDGVDLYIGAYAKSMATIGGFVASDKDIIDFLRYNMRSQIYAKSLPMPIVEGCIKRLQIIDSPEGDERRAHLWKVTRRLQEGFREMGFDIGPAEACVTPVHVKAGLEQATNIVVDLRQNYRIFCSVVIYPVIPLGMVIFRIIPTAAHSMEDVEYTLAAFKDIKERLDRGEYDKPIPDISLYK